MNLTDDELTKLYTLRLRFLTMLLIHLTNKDNPPK